VGRDQDLCSRTEPQRQTLLCPAHLTVLRPAKGSRSFLCRPPLWEREALCDPSSHHPHHSSSRRREKREEGGGRPGDRQREREREL